VIAPLSSVAPLASPGAVRQSLAQVSGKNPQSTASTGFAFSKGHYKASIFETIDFGRDWTSGFVDHP
jgi:hypothetical protein